jgi:single-strand DNA-binding protein
MNLFAYDGRLAKAPELTRPNGAAVCRFTLIRNEYRGVDAGTGSKRDERKVAIPFTAFDAQAEAIAKHAMQGDQLLVRARVENNVYEKDGADVHGYNFVVQEFDFGAPGPQKREQLNDR